MFDCSARSGDGESLNDKLLLGPDLVNSVVGVLIRFRQHPVAVEANIKGMLSQVMVEEADWDALDSFGIRIMISVGHQLLIVWG